MRVYFNEHDSFRCIVLCAASPVLRGVCVCVCVCVFMEYCALSFYTIQYTYIDIIYTLLFVISPEHTPCVFIR